MLSLKNRLPYRLILITILALSVLGLSIQSLKADFDYNDNFDDGNSDGWTANLGSWWVSSGEYHTSAGIVSNGISTLNGANYTDCVIETQLRFTDSVGYEGGIVFRYLDNSHYYAFQIGHEYDHMEIITYDAANPDYGNYAKRAVIQTLFGNNSIPINLNVNYTLRIEIQGTNFKAYFNGQHVLSWTDSSYSSGLVGLRARNAGVAFDNFQVGSYPQPTPSPAPSPTPSPSPSPSPTISPEPTAWWNSQWSCRKQITLNEASGSTLEQFPILVTFEHSGKTQSTGNDIRLIDNGNEVPYSVEAITSTYATIVFNINLNSLSSKTLYLYYGNSQANAPNYPLMPLQIYQGISGNATIDNRIFIGWKNVAWGASPGYYLVGGSIVYLDNNAVTLWDDFRIDTNNNGVFDSSEDLLTDLGSWTGGIGRSHVGLANYVERSYGLGNFLSYVRTPNYVDLVFADAKLRVYKGQNFVETTQADRLQMESASWDYACYQGATEQNIIDGLNTNGVPSDPKWNTLYSSTVNPGWMAYRNSAKGYILGGIGFETNPSYSFRFIAKEAHAFDRLIFFDYTDSQIQDPYDQPTSCKIYWYADNSNSYANINKTAKVLSNLPQFSLLAEESNPNPTPTPAPTQAPTSNPTTNPTANPTATPRIPEFPPLIVIVLVLTVGSTVMLTLKRKFGNCFLA